MLTHHEETAEEERWPLPEREPAVTARPYEEAGIRLATGSLNHEREVAKGRSAWLAFMLRAADRVEGAVRRLLRKRPRSADDLDDLVDIWPSPRLARDRSQLEGAEEPSVTDERWPRKDVDPEFDEKMRAMGARIPTRSLSRPRYIAQRRPVWLAFLLRLVLGPARD